MVIGQIMYNLYWTAVVTECFFCPIRIIAPQNTEESGKRLKMKMSLLDVMALQAGCMYLSDLRRMGSFQKRYLARELKNVEAKDEDLFDWNDALEYITGKKEPCPCAEEAKAALIAALTANCTESEIAR